jgi:hypothetical protein
MRAVRPQTAIYLPLNWYEHAKDYCTYLYISHYRKCHTLPCFLHQRARHGIAANRAGAIFHFHSCRCFLLVIIYFNKISVCSDFSTSSQGDNTVIYVLIVLILLAAAAAGYFVMKGK